MHIINSNQINRQLKSTSTDCTKHTLYKTQLQTFHKFKLLMKKSCENQYKPVKK